MYKLTKIIAPAVFVVVLAVAITHLIYPKFLQNAEMSHPATCSSVSVPKIDRHITAMESNVSKYASSSKELHESTEGGEQITYSDKSGVAIVRQKIFRETGNAELVFYFSNGHVFYIRWDDTKYERPYYVDPPVPVASVDHNEYYLSEDQTLCYAYTSKVIQPIDIKIRDLVNTFILSVEQKNPEARSHDRATESQPNQKEGKVSPSLSSCDSGLLSDVASRLNILEENASQYVALSKTEKIPELDQIRNRQIYSKKGQVVIVQDRYLGDVGMSDVSYYLSNGRVFFLLKYSGLYDKPLSSGGSKIIKHVEQRKYYFDVNETLCSWYLGGDLQPIDSDALDYVGFLISSLKEERPSSTNEKTNLVSGAVD